MKELLQEYSSYNVWANAKMLELISSMPAEMQNKMIVSSFNSLQKTLLHIWYAESIWWQRIKLQETVTFTGNENTSYDEIATGLMDQSKLWLQWVTRSSVAAFEHEFIYRNLKKEQFKQPVYQVLLHLFNHGTYHRGQLVTMLRQSGIEHIPPTDFIVYCRIKR